MDKWPLRPVEAEAPSAGAEGRGLGNSRQQRWMAGRPPLWAAVADSLRPLEGAGPEGAGEVVAVAAAAVVADSHNRLEGVWH